MIIRQPNLDSPGSAGQNELQLVTMRCYILLI